MHRTFFLTLIYFIFLSEPVKGQQRSAMHKIILKGSPLSALDLVLPNLQLGAEYQVNRFGIELDYGIPLYNSLFATPHGIADRNYYKVRTELKYFGSFPRNPIKQRKGYLGLEYFVVQEVFSDKDGNFIDRRGDAFHFDNDHVNYSVHGLCAKLGYYRYTGRFVFDLFVGLGIRGVQVHHEPVGAIPDPSFHAVNEWSFGPPYRWETDFKNIHLSLGFKVGYLIVGKIPE